MKLSVVIPTKNEAANIAACVRSFAEPLRRGTVEVIVVDNASADDTRRLAADVGARVFEQGPERCAQRNLGWRRAAGEWILFLDADMILPPPALAEILAVCDGDRADAWYIPEVRAGRGWRAAARNFERSFYNGTCIDGLRLVRRSFLETIGGYDETLVACEDWDLDRRLLAAGVRTAILSAALIHNETRVTFRTFLAKKAYYAQSVGRYRAKWADDALVRRQFGVVYRYWGVFTEKGKWRRVLRHPVLFLVVLAERIAVGATYLLAGRR
jgi:glycosyltransferase involved in cell wall biosynthesis